MNSIVVKDVHKKFRVYYDKSVSLKEKVLFHNRNRFEDRWVLNGISFEVEKGEVLGLIGKNGCGKSTLLKLLSKIIYPDGGTIEINGRVSSLIELGAGFHPDMSGRENIYTNAAIFGMSKSEIHKRIQKIIDFSELEEFIDNPVRTYSSGMYMRLAFAVAINVDADVLLIDEILAVGDANFQIKCYEKLRELKAEGTTIVIVTHDTTTIENFCNKAIWIENGKMLAYDKAPVVVDKYLDFMNERRYEQKQEEKRKESKSKEIEAKQLEQEVQSTENTVSKQKASIIKEDDLSKQDENSTEDKSGENKSTEDNSTEDKQLEDKIKDNKIYIENVVLRNEGGLDTLVLKENMPISIEISYTSKVTSEEYIFGIAISTIDGYQIYGTNTQIDGQIIEVKPGKGKVTFRSDAIKLLSGQYFLNVAVHSKNNDFKQYIRNYCQFDIISGCKAIGVIEIDHKWIH